MRPPMVRMLRPNCFTEGLGRIGTAQRDPLPTPRWPMPVIDRVIGGVSSIFPGRRLARPKTAYAVGRSFYSVSHSTP